MNARLCLGILIAANLHVVGMCGGDTLPLRLRPAWIGVYMGQIMLIIAWGALSWPPWPMRMLAACVAGAGACTAYLFSVLWMVTGPIVIDTFTPVLYAMSQVVLGIVPLLVARQWTGWVILPPEFAAETLGRAQYRLRDLLWFVTLVAGGAAILRVAGPVERDWNQWLEWVQHQQTTALHSMVIIIIQLVVILPLLAMLFSGRFRKLDWVIICLVAPVYALLIAFIEIVIYDILHLYRAPWSNHALAYLIQFQTFTVNAALLRLSGFRFERILRAPRIRFGPNLISS